MGNLVSRAKEFASVAHGSISQKRKYTGEPYIVHPCAVAELVATVTEDETLVAAAWLHDTVEDTPVTYQQIKDNFGITVAKIVKELTKISSREDGDRATRRAIDRQYLAQASAQAKTIKLADIIDNVSSVVEHDRRFAQTYLPEKELMLKVLKEGDSRLYKIAVNAVVQAKQELAALHGADCSSVKTEQRSGPQGISI